MKKYVAGIGIIAALLLAGGFFLTPKTPAQVPAPSKPVAIAPSTQPPTPTQQNPSHSTASPSTVTAPQITNVPAPLPAQPSSPATLSKPAELVTSDGTRYPVRRYSAAIVPNDPVATQWWTTSTDLPAAWDRGWGSYQTTVAVIDTGFGLNHQDLTGRWATNSGESGSTSAQAASQLNCTDRGLTLNASCNRIDDNYDTVIDNESGAVSTENPSQLNCSDQGKTLDKSCNLIDDDGNGYVDDTRGWDFANYDRTVQAGETDPYGSSTMHGTMTSGTLGATGNNGKGIAGVNWNTKILPIQALDDDGYGDTLTLTRSIIYAVSRGVDVISLSLGTTQEDAYVRQAVRYALSQGVIVVAAAGNEVCDCISYPARYPEVLAVGSHDASGNPSSFSNYGASLDLLAPGENMTLPAWGPSLPTNGYVTGAAGTSFATPYVAGLLAQLKSLEPAASYGELIAALNETATHTGLSVAAPRSNTRGYGLVHAGRSTARVTLPSLSTMRYQLAPLNSTTALDSIHTYDCMGTYPSAELYELSKNGQIIYTISDFQKILSANNGWTSRSMGYQCVGQPIDTPSTTRTINLFQEIRNGSTKPQ